MMNTHTPAPGESGIERPELDWAQQTESRLLAILLLLSALPWGLYAWNTAGSLHLVPALLAVFVSVAGFMATARIALLPAEWLLRLLLPRYRRAQCRRGVVGNFRTRQ